MIRLMGFAGQAALRDCRAAEADFQALAALAVAGGDMPVAIRTAGEVLSEAIEAIALDGPGFGEALLEAWRALALEGDAATLPGLCEEALARPVESAAGWLSRAAICAAYSIAILRPDHASRQDARAARERFAAAVRPTLEGAGAQLGAEIAAWLSGITGEAARELTRLAATLASVVRVETAISLSAVRAAYELYGDANRAAELVDRNRAATPALMPTAFEALSA